MKSESLRRTDWSVLRPLLYAVVVEKVTTDIRDVAKELLHVDDLMILLADSWEEVESQWKR